MINKFIHATAHTITTILQEICTKGSEFDQVIDNIIAPNYHQKPELISELAISFYSNEKSVLNSIQNNYFKYFFIRTIKNQVHSNTSPFHKNCRMDVASSLSDNYDEKYDEDELNIKIETEEKMDIIEKALDKTKVTGFEAEIFKLYYYKDYTYRKIEKETGVDHVLAYVTVKKVLNKVKKQIGKNNIY
jgi:RNA polymerase sigma factor (sigma-70 family)